MIYNSILETVGLTPCVRVHRLNLNPEVQIYLKLEGSNPTSSIKDRAAINMIHHAEREQLLKPGGTIIESTSGNLGKSLAMVGAALGYKVIIVTDPKATRATCEFCRIFGAQVEMVEEPDASGSYQNARVRRVKQLLAEVEDAYWCNQYENPRNPQAHTETTAREILDDFETLDVVVASVSTGGHLSGICRALTGDGGYPSLKVHAVDAVGSAAFGYPSHRYFMRGIGLSWTPGNLDLRQVSYLHRVADAEAFSACRLLAQQEGILVGGSGGAVLFACLWAAQSTPPPQTILGIVPDCGFDYWEDLYNDEWLARNGIPLLSTVEHLHAAAGRAKVETISPMRGKHS